MAGGGVDLLHLSAYLLHHTVQPRGRHMAQPAFEEIVEDFDFLEDWEDRYRYVIEQGKAMDPL